MKIEILVQCHNFQKRLCWMLSSILTCSVVRNNYELVVNVAHLKGNGTPTTEDVVEYFKQICSLKIKLCTYELNEADEFARRGNVRNRQVTMLDEDADFVLFSDSDMIYDKFFFDELVETVAPYIGQKAVHCVGRYSSIVDEVTEIVDRLDYPALPTIMSIEEMIDKCNIKRRNVGAGYFQMVEQRFLDGIYVEKANDKHMFNEIQKAKSDIQFRKRIGRRIKHDNMNNKQYHINHVRDNEVGEHLEIQR